MSNPQGTPQGHDELKPLPEISTGKWRHYKGNYYWVHGVAYHSETLEPMVVYRRMDEDADGWSSKYPLWTRPFSMWHETVEHDGKEVVRFEKVSG